tara:strand:+ start:207 stop:902 length:696 start_codon:yes stop_codon:yes gene_type:complete
MARGRELSQLGSLITVDDSTKNIGVATATSSQNIGIGTLSPTSKVEVVGDVSISGVITATTFSGDGSGLSNVPGTGGMSNVVEDTTPELGGDLDVNGNDITGTGNVNITGIVTTTELSLSNTSTANRKALVGSWTATAGILTSIDTITTSDFKTIEYTLHIENSVGIQAQKVLVSRSGTTPYSQEYAIMYSSDLLVSIGSSYAGGNYYLNATPETGISGVTTYNFVREIMS